MSDQENRANHRRGFGLREKVEPELEAHYRNALVDHICQHDHTLTIGDLTIRLAREFGFCYGVDRAVEFAYETRLRFPDRQVWLIGEIIHNPHVNEKMLEMGIGFLFGRYSRDLGYEAVGKHDVVILPAFGIPLEDMERLGRIGCTLVDTTCGSVILVWKNVERYARDGFTSIIHGKFYHEETMATASRAIAEGGHYLIVRNLTETQMVCDSIRNGGMGREQFLEQFDQSISPGFDPDVHLKRIGLANQTTMLKSESIKVAEALSGSMRDRYGEDRMAEHFRNFETICTATQERQDAILELLDNPLDLMVVIGGYNSSNTNNLSNIAGPRVTTYHIESARGILSGNGIMYKPVGERDPVTDREWLRKGALQIGITAGASTPDSEIGDTILRILDTLDLELPPEVSAVVETLPHKTT
ncbi:4-hydroxy-3-methylbut-2-enyl diphosphate reductase [Gemmatimonadota bacterium]